MKTVKIKNQQKEFTVGKIVCVGRNYAAHAAELGNELPQFPLIFLKPSSAIIYSGDSIKHPDFSNNLHHEVELVLLIGKTIKNATKEVAEEAIYAYSVGLDMTLRDIQNEMREKGDPWTLAKCFDNSAVLAEFVLKEDYNLTLDETIKLTVDGVERQNSKLNKMIFKPVEIVEYISNKMTLEVGDLIFTGTPEGVSKVVSGDIIEASIENIAELNTKII